MMSNGTVVISLDTELEWGFHGFDINHKLQNGRYERKMIMKLISLFDEFNAPATWAIVGHLFLESCNGEHPEVIAPNHKPGSGGWFAEDPGTTVNDAPLRYGKDIVKEIIEAKVNHEIATHTFSHVLCSRDWCTRNIFESEISYSLDLASKMGIEISSLIYPRNEISFKRSTRNAGITAYRGHSPEYELRWNKPLGKYRKYLRFLLGQPAPIVQPREVLNGLWEIPASQYLPYNPFDRMNESLPWNPRVRRAKQSIRKVTETGGLYHLWAHPHNFDNKMIRDLREILLFANQQEVPIRPMREVIPC